MMCLLFCLVERVEPKSNINILTQILQHAIIKTEKEYEKMVIWCGNSFSNEKVLEKYKQNSRLVLDYQLAVESYMDFNNQKIEEFSSINKLWAKRKSSSTNEQLDEDQLLDLSCQVLDAYKKLVGKIGEDQFIFYDDGSMIFNWPKKNKGVQK